MPWVAIPAPVPRLGRLNRACSGYRDPVAVQELFAAVLRGADVRLDGVRTGRQVHRHRGLPPVWGGRVQSYRLILDHGAGAGPDPDPDHSLEDAARHPYLDGVPHRGALLRVDQPDR